MVEIIKRFLNSLLWPKFRLVRIFTPLILDEIENFVKEAEEKLNVEIYIVIESALPLRYILTGKTPTCRAKDLFCLEKVWDTQLNNGILIYLNYSESDIEIIYDRGIVTTSMQIQSIIDKFTVDIRSDLLEAFSNLIDELGKSIELKETALNVTSRGNELLNRPKI